MSNPGAGAGAGGIHVDKWTVQERLVLFEIVRGGVGDGKNWVKKPKLASVFNACYEKYIFKTADFFRLFVRSPR